MNVSHDEGKHKAYVFKSVLGITVYDAEELRVRILDEILINLAVAGKEDKYGKRYSVRFSYTREQRTATVLTAWIIRSGENFPRLTSCYVDN